MILKILFFLLTLSFSTMAQTFVDPKTNAIDEKPIGKVSKIVGRIIRVPFKNRSVEEPLKMDDAIHKGDQIKTSEKSLVRFTMNDETAVTLGPDSEFEFTKYDEDEKGGRKATYNFLLGHLRAKVIKKAEPGDLEFKMRKVSMGIRGTEIVAEIALDKAQNYVTKVLLTEGKAFIDLSQLSLKSLKELNLDIGKMLDTSLAKNDSKATDLLIPLTEVQLKNLLTFANSDYQFPFIKDMNNLENLDGKALDPDGEKAPWPTTGHQGLDSQTKTSGIVPKKNWKEILDENQKKKKSRKKIVDENDD